MLTAEVRLLRAERQSPAVLSLDKRAESALQQPPASPQRSVEGPGAAIEWLGARQITVKDYRHPEAADDVFDELSLFLGERFDTLTRLHEVIRKSFTNGPGFYLNLAGRSQEEVANATHFGDLLKQYAFVSAYRYDRENKVIKATVQRTGNVINFFNGGWFERYVFLKIAAFLQSTNLRWECLNNPKITLSNGDDFELDLFFLIDNQPLWVECKTGGYQAYITRYTSMRRDLSIPKARSILTILGITGELARKLTSLHEISVANEKTFLDVIAHSVKQADNAAAQPPEPPLRLPPPDTAPVDVVKNGRLSTLLNKVQLRPMPEHRMRVIKELVAIVEAHGGPITMVEAKALLAARMPLSKSQLQELLNAVVRSGCLLDAAGEPVASFTIPVARLVSSQPLAIHERCLESYVMAILRVEPEFFDAPHNRDEFERTVGAKAPDGAVILALKQRLHTAS